MREMLGKGLHTVRCGSTAKVLADCKLKYYRTSGCCVHLPSEAPLTSELLNLFGWNTAREETRWGK